MRQIVAWKSRKIRTFAFVVAATSMIASANTSFAENPSGARWPSFRGPSASGYFDGATLPAVWNVETGQNVAWKTDVPGLGLSSPIAWSDRVYLTTAVSDKGQHDLKVGLYGDIAPVTDPGPHSFRVMAFDLTSGALVWDKEAHRGIPRIMRHPKASHANCTPATDGQRIVAFFGSEGLYCFDTAGELMWKKDLGVLDAGYYVVPTAQWEFASSPVIHEGKVLVQCDVQKGSFVAAFSLADGAELWRTPREEVPCWSTPTVHVAPDRAQVILNGYKHIGGYDLNTGAELWKLRGGGDIPVPTPVVANDLVYITNAHGQMAPIYAIRTSASGDITPSDEASKNEHIGWWYAKRGAYMQTPLVYGDLLYSCKDNGILTVFDAKSGEKIYSERLGTGSSGFTASPVGGDGKVYFTSEDGDIHVVRAGKAFELLSKNAMSSSCMATPAIAGNKLLIRTKSALVALSEKSK